MVLAAGRGVHRAVSAPLSPMGQGQEAAVLLEQHILTGLEDIGELLTSSGFPLWLPPRSLDVDFVYFKCCSGPLGTWYDTAR